MVARVQVFFDVGMAKLVGHKTVLEVSAETQPQFARLQT